ncbi:hypothetical protein NDU88_004932 [Pleurodeles waltl]|uniref:Uncharacterized protein n=1 Tax=Pleurodeles waltl TaxID=8319 RepID=A0AAV7LN50_PLEWA|nr:hypothetical protein NDU88_004932 [Pleurodeles waltl]
MLPCPISLPSLHCLRPQYLHALHTVTVSSTLEFEDKLGGSRNPATTLPPPQHPCLGPSPPAQAGLSVSPQSCSRPPLTTTSSSAASRQPSVVRPRKRSCTASTVIPGVPNSARYLPHDQGTPIAYHLSSAPGPSLTLRAQDFAGRAGLLVDEASAATLYRSRNNGSGRCSSLFRATPRIAQSPHTFSPVCRARGQQDHVRLCT